MEENATRAFDKDLSARFIAAKKIILSIAEFSGATVA